MTYCAGKVRWTTAAHDEGRRGVRLVDQFISVVLVLLLVAATISTVRSLGRMSRSRKRWFGRSSSNYSGNYVGDSGGSSDCGSDGGGSSSC